MARDRRMRVEPLEDRRMLAITVDTLVDELDGSITDGDVSLRDAIAAAPSGETIDFSVTGTITLTLGELKINKAIMIAGPGEALLTIDASGNDPTPDQNNGDGSRVFTVADSSLLHHVAVEFSGMTLTGGDAGGLTYAQSVGGAIYSEESLTLSHVTLVDNAAIFSGGGLYARSPNGANTLIMDSSILNNDAQDGGGIDLAGNGQLTRVLVSGNQANDYYGGGLVLMQGSADYSVVVDDCEIINNSAAGIGGGIVGRYFSLQNSRVAGNVAQGDGGGIYMEESFTLQGNEIADNASYGSGGGVHISIGNDHIAKVIQNNTFAGNHSAIGGGGLSTRSRVFLEGNTFEGNTSDRHGGGLVITSNSANNVVVNNQFPDNHAVLDGGGLFVYQEGQNRIEKNEFAENSSGLNGGGMFVEMRSGAFALLDNEFIDNRAVQSGGGLYVDTQHDDIAGEITIDENDFAQNKAASGGGFAIVTDADGFSAEVTNNSIYENTAGSGGGVGLLVAAGDIDFSGNSVYRNDALGAFSDGGGMQILNAGGTVRVVNSTISTNNAGSTGGGLSIVTQGGTTSVAHSTIARNNTNSPAGGGGGIFYVGTGLVIDHTIVTNNSSASAVAGLQNLYDLSGNAAITHSLLSGNSMLGDLLDNGLTLTHALLPGSPAINAGDATAVAGVGSVPLFDQRGEGFDRVEGGRIDIGAVERSAMTIVVDTKFDENDGDHSVGDLSLREAVAMTNAQLGADVTIEFSETLAGETILLTQGQLLVATGVRIIGLGADRLTIDASGNDPTPDLNNGDGSRIFAFQSPSSIAAEYVVAGLTLTGGDTGGGRGGGTGGAITANGKLTVVDCVLTDNSSGSGGAIFTGSELLITGSMFTDNSAASSQGGALGGGGTLLISDSVFADNTAPLGGAIGYQFGTVTISDSVIQDNIATHVGGGGIWMGGGSVQVLRSAITGNSAQMSGGGISAPTVLVEASLISGNFAGQDGGGILGLSLTATNSTISGNSADRNGGGVWAQGTVMLNHNPSTGPPDSTA